MRFSQVKMMELSVAYTLYLLMNFQWAARAGTVRHDVLHLLVCSRAGTVRHVVVLQPRVYTRAGTARHGVLHPRAFCFNNYVAGLPPKVKNSGLFLDSVGRVICIEWNFISCWIWQHYFKDGNLCCVMIFPVFWLFPDQLNWLSVQPNHGVWWMRDCLCYVF